MSTVVEMLPDFQELYSVLLNALYSVMKNEESANEVYDAMNYDIFEDLKTGYEQEKYFTENFHFVVSKLLIVFMDQN